MNIALSSPASSSVMANRLTHADVATVRGSIANTMRSYPPGYQPSIGADFNALNSAAYEAIHAAPFALRESEVDEIADIVLAAIMGADAR